MTRDNICKNVDCDMPALIGYEHCPRHLVDLEAMEFDNSDTAERLGRVYEAMYPESATVDEEECYRFVDQLGYEVASRYRVGTGWRFHVVLAD